MENDEFQRFNSFYHVLRIEGDLFGELKMEDELVVNMDHLQRYILFLK